MTMKKMTMEELEKTVKYLNNKVIKHDEKIKYITDNVTDYCQQHAVKIEKVKRSAITKQKAFMMAFYGALSILSFKIVYYLCCVFKKIHLLQSRHETWIEFALCITILIFLLGPILFWFIYLEIE